MCASNTMISMAMATRPMPSDSSSSRIYFPTCRPSRCWLALVMRSELEARIEHRAGRVEQRQDVATQFTAMASPCLVLVDCADEVLGAAVGEIVKAEAQRIEAKFSRYRPSVVTHINESAGRPVTLDEETADLIDYAVTCYQLSEGRFDITSGVLRRVWRFDGSAKLPTEQEVRDVLRYVGWHRVVWNRPVLRLAEGMEIDFGGIGKEYAVDRAIDLARRRTAQPLLVNLGGDLR